MARKKRSDADDPLSWFDANRDNGYLKILAGVRGAGKTLALGQIRSHLLEQRIPEPNIVFLDFEDPKNRRIKTCKEALAAMDLDSRPGVKHVFLDEVGYLPDFRRLLGVLFADRDCRILISTSNARVLQPDCLDYFSGRLTRFDLYPDPARTRMPSELESLWNKAFVRDVLGGNTLTDAYAEERIAEYLSDCRGDFISSRRLADDVSFAGRHLSHVTAGLYMQHLEDAFLVEKVPLWDAEENVASTRRFAYYFTDLEMRRYLFGDAPDRERDREACNSAYLALRRRFRVPVCAVRGEEHDADFVTVVDGEAVFWFADRLHPGNVVETDRCSVKA